MGRRFENEKGAAEKPLPTRDLLLSQALLETIQEVKKLVEFNIVQMQVIDGLLTRVENLEHEVSLLRLRSK